MILDIGCWDGKSFLSYVPVSAVLFGAELVLLAAAEAGRAGVRVVSADITSGLPFKGGVFDIITSNQVIEHVVDTDAFVAECFRCLAPGGVAVISTENLASWHNIIALLAGWQPFSLTNVSDRRSVLGNPVGYFRHFDRPNLKTRGQQHVRVFARRGLLELFEAHGFCDCTVAGAGYYPLPAWIGRVERRHAAFITIACRKPGDLTRRHTRERQPEGSLPLPGRDETGKGGAGRADGPR